MEGWVAANQITGFLAPDEPAQFVSPPVAEGKSRTQLKLRAVQIRSNCSRLSHAALPALSRHVYLQTRSDLAPNRGRGASDLMLASAIRIPVN